MRLLLTSSPWLQTSAAQPDSFIEIRPSKIICVGRNYRAHANELGNRPTSTPLLFFKPPSALIEAGTPIIRPNKVGRIDFEGELAIIIGKRGRRIPAAAATTYILGATCLNDVTARDLQKSEKQWARAKGFDTFCPLGPRVVRGSDWNDVSVVTRQNGVEVQRGRTSQMIHSIATVIEHASAAMTLEVGDIIATGTPSGVGPISPGDIIEIDIEGIGVLQNPVVAGCD